jgi:hypothetical protein
MNTQTETGCLVDGNIHGIYTYQRVCQIALDVGWRGIMPTDDDIEIAAELADEAIDYLNSNYAEEGYRYDWHDGSVMYWADTEWETVTP